MERNLIKNQAGSDLLFLILESFAGIETSTIRTQIDWLK